MKRQYVHLSADAETALVTGKRRGNAVLLRVSALEMYHNGEVFYLADNNVWLARAVPAKYINPTQRHTPD